MEIITNTSLFYLDLDTAVAIGKFDGIHIGHRKLLQEICAKKAQGLAACVFTFDPAPAVLFGASDGKELTTREEKRKLFEALGVDILIEFPMTKETASIPPEEFVREILHERMRARFVAAGPDLSFGDRGAGNSKLLQEMGVHLGIQTRVIDKICVDGVEAGSTYVRTLVEKGEMEKVRRLLGVPYCISGTVAHGRQLGRTIGFPTVNIYPPESKLLPPYGVYLSSVKVDGVMYNGISNVGCKPTVEKKAVCGVETFLYEFDRDIYGAEIEVYLWEFRRPERKFETMDALIACVHDDIAVGRAGNRLSFGEITIDSFPRV